MKKNKQVFYFLMLMFLVNSSFSQKQYVFNRNEIQIIEKSVLFFQSESNYNISDSLIVIIVDTFSYFNNIDYNLLRIKKSIKEFKSKHIDILLNKYQKESQKKIQEKISRKNLFSFNFKYIIDSESKTQFNIRYLKFSKPIIVKNNYALFTLTSYKGILNSVSWIFILLKEKNQWTIVDSDIYSVS